MYDPLLPSLLVPIRSRKSLINPNRSSSHLAGFPRPTSTKSTCERQSTRKTSLSNLTDTHASAMEIFVTCLWIATVALLSWECQTWDAAEDVVSDVLSSEQAALVNSLPNQDSGILSLRAATALASINCVFWAVTLFVCKFRSESTLN